MPSRVVAGGGSRADGFGGGLDMTVVIGTRNRRERALRTVQRLRALPEQPHVVVVDDASEDDTAGAVAAAHPEVGVVRLERHGGVTTARNTGVRTAATPYVAFADDDSWWAPGALPLAARLFDRHPRLALIAARVLVGDEQRLDPASAVMAQGLLPSAGLPGPRVLGFVACGAVVRREAFLAVGGFPEDYVIMGEEDALALALASARWDLAYVADVVAYHAPHEARRDPASRVRRQTRNALWTAWRYRRPWGAIVETATIVGRAQNRAALAGTVDAVRGLPGILATRQAVSPEIEAQRRRLDAATRRRRSTPAG